MKNVNQPQIKKAVKEFYAEMAAEDARYSRTGKHANHSEPKKRPVKNYTKAWSEHVEDWDEVDDFFGK